MEGVFHKRITHTILDTSGTKVTSHLHRCHYMYVRTTYIFQYRYVVFHIEFKHGCQRKYDPHGKEVEPNFGQTGLVRTGYLQSTYSKDSRHPLISKSI